MQIELIFHANETIKCDCGYLTKLFHGKKLCNDTIANFQIYGTNDEFAIEPSCGRLHDVNIYFVYLLIIQLPGAF